MKKSILIPIIILIPTVLIAIGFININKIINSNKDLILERVRKKLGREIKVDKISVAFRGGIGVRFENFALADDPAFSNGEFVEARDLHVKAEFWPLFKREFKIRKAVLHSPVIRVIRNERGELNLNSVGAAAGKATVKGAPAKSPEQAVSPLAIAFVDIDNGQIIFEDRKRGTELRITRISSRLSDLDFSKPVSIDLRAALLSPKENTQLKGEISLAERPKVDIRVKLSDLDLKKVADMLPEAGKLGIGGEFDMDVRLNGEIGSSELPAVKGRVSISEGRFQDPRLPSALSGIEVSLKLMGDHAKIEGIKLNAGSSTMEVKGEIKQFKPAKLAYTISSPRLNLKDFVPPSSGSPGLGEIGDLEANGNLEMSGDMVSGKGTVSSGKGTINQLAYENLEATFSVVGKEIVLENLSFNAADGSFKSSGRINLASKVPRFAADTELERVDLVDFLRFLPAGAQNIFKGDVNMSLSFSGRGKDWNEIKGTLSGNGLTEVLKGEFVNFNIISSVFEGLKQYPMLSNLISEQMRAKYPKVFSSKNTEFESWQSDLVIEEGKLKVRHLALNADDYDLEGKGYLDLGLGLDLSLTLIASRSLSEDLSKSAGIVRYFINKDGKLEVPLRMQGKLPRVKVTPDETYLQETLRRALFQESMEGLKKKGLKDLFRIPKKQR